MLCMCDIFFDIPRVEVSVAKVGEYIWVTAAPCKSLGAPGSVSTVEDSRVS